MKNKIFLIISFLFIFINVKADVDIHFFYSETCPHCSEAEKNFKAIENKYDFNIIAYETSKNKDNSALLKEVAAEFGDYYYGVPYIVVENQRLIGWNDSSNDKLIYLIKEHNKENKCSVVEAVLNENVCEIGEDIIGKVKIPLIGYVEPENASLGLISMIIGLVDGFNPCAMWVLFFLLSILINMKDRKRMWAIGLTFMLTSAIIYLLMIGSWIKIAISINEIIIIRTIIAVLAIFGGLFNLYNFLRPSPTGCNVTNNEDKTKTMNKIRMFCSEKKLLFALIGAAGLAISVNIVELACSAGLPVVFAEILSVNNLTSAQNLMYLLIYVFFFMLDDLVIFVIAMITMKLTGISNKYGKYSHLIGGLIMLIVGILLIFKPEWIMLDF